MEGYERAPDGDARAYRAVRLPPFWSESPDTWFGVAEAQFQAEDLHNSRRKFFCAVAALPLAVARTARHLINNPPQLRPYERLREFLTATHTLSNYERVLQIQAMGPLGGRKPTELLYAMQESCPPGEEETEWFRANFLHSLPEKVRILLLEDQEDLRTLALRADNLIAHQGIGSVAAVTSAPSEVDGEPIAAVHSQSGNRGRFRGRGGGRGGRGGRRHDGQGQQQQQRQQDGQSLPDPSPMQLSVTASGLCHAHFKYGKRAFTCFPPCSWQGN